MAECKIRLLDEVSAAVIGLNPAHMETLYNHFAVQSPNYFFNPNYKLGRWDGKIRYFQKTGKTYAYLLEEILPLISKFGYKIELDDCRSVVADLPEYATADMFKHIKHMDTGMSLMLRDYQLNAVNRLIEAGNGVCLAATGAGKTIMCAALVTKYDEIDVRSLTIVPDQTLIRQTKLEYLNCGLDTGEYSGNEKTLHHKHVVSTWQALQNNPKIVELFQMVIVDECHGLRGNVLNTIICQHAARLPFRFGFTGTLPKDESERMLVHVSVGPVRDTITAKQLIDAGVLATPHIDIIQLEENLREEYNAFCREDVLGSKPPTYIQFKDGYFPDYAAEKSYLHRNVTRTEWIADFLLAKRDLKKGNTLCLVSSITFGRQLAALIPGAIFVNGQDVKSVTKRQEVYDLFKTHDDLIVIATVNIAGTGLNIRRIFNLVLIDVGKSFTRVIQAIGRGLRTADDKTTVSITDICSDLKYGKKHLKMRTNYYDEAMYPYAKRKVDYTAIVDML